MVFGLLGEMRQILEGVQRRDVRFGRVGPERKDLEDDAIITVTWHLSEN